MNRNDIITEIYNDKQYINYCKKVCQHGDLYNDLFQYVVLYLMEMPEKRLIELHESGGLKMYIARIIYANGTNPTRQFMRQYISDGDLDYKTIGQLDESNENDDYETKINHINKGIKTEIKECINKGFYPASVKLLEIYAECGSYQEVANRTKIPYKTVYRHINSLREKLIND